MVVARLVLRAQHKPRTEAKEIMTSAQNTSPEQETQSGTESSQYLTFILAEEEYAIDILRVQGIQGWDTVTAIPNTPEYILGVINLRGSVVPIVELRRRFKLESVPFGPTTVVIIVKIKSGDKERTLGIVVDAVSEVYSLLHKDVRPAPDFGNAGNIDFVKGVATVEDKMLILLNVDELLDDNVLDSTPAATAA